MHLNGVLARTAQWCPMASASRLDSW
jgi:hypothetical protein